MTDESNPKREKQDRADSLAVNRETVQDLTDQEAERAAGGLRAPVRRESEVSCDAGCE
jgi:hypothetical protein